MHERFSVDILYALRNEVSIRHLIREVLDLPSKTASDGTFHFLCPLCLSFETATHLKTNLARCFLCQKNFNPIDLTMIVKHYSFVESVHFLSPFLPK